MIAPPAPTLRLDIDTAALEQNWRALDRLSHGARAAAAVKANCYGLGVDACVPVLRDAGCRDFFVAHWSEVDPVLSHVDPAQVSVLHGPVSIADAAYARATGVRPVIDSIREAKLWADSGGGACDLMIDTGINRLGIAPGEISDPIISSLQVHTLLSHLACADEDSAMNARQLAAFQAVLPLVPHRRASLANSAGIALGSDYAFDLTRPGLSLYGGVPRQELADAIHQVAFPHAAIIQTRTISAGDSVGYNGTFTATGEMKTGIVSLGYADGFLRVWGGAGLRHEAAPLPILGKVSMDMVVIDLTGAPELKEGDWVEVPYDLQYGSRHTGLSQYELLTILGRRFAR